MHNIKLLYEKCNKNNGIYILICNDLFKWHGIISFFIGRARFDKHTTPGGRTRMMISFFDLFKLPVFFLI